MYVIWCKLCWRTAGRRVYYVGFTDQWIQDRTDDHRNRVSGFHDHFILCHNDIEQKKHIDIFVVAHSEDRHIGEAMEQKLRQLMLAEAKEKNVELVLLSKKMN